MKSDESRTMLYQSEHHSPLPDFLPALGKRIAVMAELVGSKKRLADAAGISESQLYRCIKGSSATTIEPLVAMAMAANVSLEWLILGHGDMRTGSSSSSTALNPEGFTRPDPAEAQPGTSAIAFSNEWLERFNKRSSLIRQLTVIGDSMAPTLNEGDLLLIDSSDSRLADGKMFVLRCQGELLIRRIQIAPQSGLYLLCDNPNYPPALITHQELDSLEIVGRVVWQGHRL